MDYQTSKSRYILTALAIILVITAFILVGLNALNLDRLRVPSLTKGGQDAQAAYVNGYLAARKKYQAMCPFATQTTLGFSGTVQQVSGNSLKVSADSLDTDPTVDGVDDVRTVTLAANATIQRNIPKSEADLARESSASPTLPPSTSTLTAIKLADIKKGDKISVTSATDVRLAATVIATSLVVQ